MQIWIVIVNYRTAALVVDCLRSLESQVGDLAGGRVLVVDNDSRDGSHEAIAAAVVREGWQDWVKILSGGRNGGFSFGNNIGICEAMSTTPAPECILLLNPDTVARPGAIMALASFMQANPKTGIVGSQLESANGEIDCSAHRAPSPLGDLDAGARLGLLSRLLARYVVSPPASTQAHACDWVSGASMLVRRQVFEDIGLMDEGFFLYFEEVDFCCRARAAGWQVWYVPESRVLHLEGASTGIRAKASRRAGYWYDSRRRFFVKHHGVIGLLLADTLWAIGRLSFLLRRALRLGGKNDAHADPHWFMFDLLWGDLRALLGDRLHAIRTGKPT
jgi:hypothetical protein